jgi:hypothetical protein
MLGILTNTVGGVMGLILGALAGAVLGAALGFVLKRRTSRWCGECGVTLNCPACTARQRAGQRPVRL